MAGISSEAAGRLENKKKYNSIEFNNDLGINIYEAFFRHLDPQTGRWWEIDPAIESMEAWSPYSSNYDSPVILSDPLGDEPEETTSGPGPKAIYTLGKELKNAYKIYKATENLGRALKEVNLEDLAGSLAPISTKPVKKGELLQKSYPEANQGAAFVIDFIEQLQGAILQSINAEKTHGNKLDDKPAEGYTLRDKDTKKVKKYGETTRGEDRFGDGKQKRYTKKELKEKNVEYNKETSGTKKNMHKWQNEKIIEHKGNNGGERPDLNKSDY